MAEGRPLGVAVVGSAFMGKAHSNAWRNVRAFYPDVPDVRQQVLVARDAKATRDLAAQYGWAEAATDWRTVIDRDDVDVVDICLPGHLHAEVAIAALEAGKHVLVEKPLANTVAEAEKMLVVAQAAQERGVMSMVGFNYRRVPALVLARDLVASGRLGDVRQVKVAYLQDWLADADAPMTWRMRKETAGSGALGDLASHAVDQVRFLLGQDVVSVSGSTETFVRRRTGADGLEDVTVDDAAWATLRTSGGAVASARGDADGHRPQELPEHRGLRVGGGVWPSTSRPSTSCRCAPTPPPASRGGWSPRPTSRTSARGGPPVTSSAGTTPSPARPPTS